MARADANSTDSRKRWRARNPEKDAAHRAVEYFVRKLRRTGASLPDCAACGVTETCAKAEGRTIQAHHTDYSRPLDVVWMCGSCHITSHWEESWREERGGRAIKVIHRTIEIDMGPA